MTIMLPTRPAILTAAVLAVLSAPVERASQAPPVMELSNGALVIAIRETGGAIASVTMADDPDRLNPLHSLGHFVCVDGFGPTSEEERAAGLQMHGEANRLPWTLTDRTADGQTTSVAFTVTLPIVQEVFRRTYRLVEGERVVYVESELESLLGFDRPVNWGEHATIGPPFLALGRTSVEMSATRAMTRSYDSQSAALPHRLASFREFRWPMAPSIDGNLIDVRPSPSASPVGDHTTSLMDPSRRLVFVTAMNADQHRLIGYVFKREEYPWTQLWENYPSNGRLARGLEFAVQPFDLPRREVTDMGRLLDTPTYRWLPAKSTIRSSFLMFYTRTPDHMRQVDDVTLDQGTITITDRSTGMTTRLQASRGL